MMLLLEGNSRAINYKKEPTPSAEDTIGLILRSKRIITRVGSTLVPVHNGLIDVMIRIIEAYDKTPGNKLVQTHILEVLRTVRAMGGSYASDIGLERVEGDAKFRERAELVWDGETVPRVQITNGEVDCTVIWRRALSVAFKTVMQILSLMEGGEAVQTPKPLETAATAASERLKPRNVFHVNESYVVNGVVTENPLWTLIHESKDFFYDVAATNRSEATVHKMTGCVDIPNDGPCSITQAHQFVDFFVLNKYASGHIGLSSMLHSLRQHAKGKLQPDMTTDKNKGKTQDQILKFMPQYVLRTYSKKEDASMYADRIEKLEFLSATICMLDNVYSSLSQFAHEIRLE